MELWTHFSPEPDGREKCTILTEFDSVPPYDRHQLLNARRKRQGTAP